MGWREWTGIGERSWEKPPNREVQPGKTLWDWLQLLIVPAILIGVSFAWSASQSRSDNKREDRRSQDATLQGYLDEMSGLMLHEKLLDSKQPNDAVRAVARTVTLTALRRLDSERKGAVVRFLHEAGLLGEPAPPALASPGQASSGADASAPATDEAADEDQGLLIRTRPLVWLKDADLRGADLTGAELTDADLSEADLTGANLERAYLGGADITASVLQDAQLTGAFLQDTDFEGAVLRDANLTDANLTGANIGGADLRGADLTGADLTAADLTAADSLAAVIGVAGDPSSPPIPLGAAAGLDLGRYVAGLPPTRQKGFLDSEKAYLDSLSRKQLSVFGLTPEQLARLRRQAENAAPPPEQG